MNGPNGINIAFSTVPLLLSARNNMNLRKISDNLQTNQCKIS